MKNKIAVVFDFDETLVTTDAKIYVYNKRVFVKTLTSSEYNFYVKKPDDKLDFSEFIDGELILKAKKYKAWPILRNINKAIKEGKSTVEIFILTARNKSTKPYIYEYLKRNGIKINLDHILTIGDNGNISISNEKRKLLKILSKKYDKIIFYDDNHENIQLAASIKNIKTKLIENIKYHSVNEKFTEDSDPIHDLGIGMMYQIKQWVKKLGYPDADNNLMLSISAQRGKTKFVKHLLSIGADVHDLNDFPLRSSCQYNYIEIAKLLLDAGADIHTGNNSPLRNASYHGNLEIVKILLDAGADVHAETDYPLRWASANGHVEVVKILLDAGADIHADKDYALRYASNNGHTEVVKLLKDHIAKEKKLKKRIKESLNEMIGVGSSPGMGNAIPASSAATTGAQMSSSSTTSSGDNWGNTVGKKLYTQAKPIKTKRKKRAMKTKRKLEEENINPYDRVGTSMAKKMNVKMPFKKKKDSKNQNAIVQRKFEHEIISFDEFKNLNENEEN